MLITGIMAIWLFFRKRLFINRFFQGWCIAMAPAGFIAVLCGWFVTESGRQPYIVYGLMRTIDVSSPVLGEYVLMSLLAFIVVYAFVFGAGTYYIFKSIFKGPVNVDHDESHEIFGQQNPSLLTHILPEHKGLDL
jgi:cytochrome d ubiquinol oxidase subunit I